LKTKKEEYMELKQYFQIIKKNFNLFIWILGMTFFLIFGYFYFCPLSYNASLTIDISRLGTQETSDYRFDDFYRLQADEKFAETIVEWLKSPQIISDIYSQSGINLEKKSLKKIAGIFEAEKRSSQVVFVEFSASSEKDAQEISKNLIKIISQETEKLNVKQKNKDWFFVLGNEPVIRKNTPDYLKVIGGTIFAGFFLSFWGVLLKHYLE